MTQAKQKCLLYARVSSKSQLVDGSGLESQEHRCRQHAKEKNYYVEKVFTDDVSGGGDFMKRPGMVALLKYLKKHHRTEFVVIFDDLKRLARDTMTHWQLRYAMMDVGARVECLNYKFDDTPEGEFIETLFAAQGQLERKQIGRQTRQKTKARLEAGFYTFNAPFGLKYSKCKTRGKVLVHDEPIATVMTEMLNGFASGRFQTKEEARVFLEQHPDFPTAKSGRIGNHRITKLLRNPLYAGYLEFKDWGVSFRKAQHEGLISYETYLKIQERMKGHAIAPARRDLNKDFVLRGAIACECGNSLTASWSKSKTGRRYAYYVCQNRKCEFKGKSIPRAKLEDAFEELLEKLTPPEVLVAAGQEMFKQIWRKQVQSVKYRKEAFEQDYAKIEQQTQHMLDRIVEANSPKVIQAFEKRIDELEEKKLLLREKIENVATPNKDFDEMYRTSLDYLTNPLKIWRNNGFAEKRAVLKLTFKDRITYLRNGLYRTPDLTLPFKVLDTFLGLEKRMVPDGGLELPTIRLQGGRSTS